MINFFRIIRQRLLTESKFSKYLLYAIGEILLVVIGILIALQINNSNTNRIKKQFEMQSYKNIKSQLVDDLEEITNVYNYNKNSTKQIEHAIKLIANKDFRTKDTLAILSMSLSMYSNFFGSGNIYESLANSGDLKLLKNPEIPRKLLKLEMTYTFINSLEDQNWDMLMEELSPELRGVINYSTFKAVKPEKLYSLEMQNLFVEFKYLTAIKDSIYSRAITEIVETIEMIDDELDSNNIKR